MINPWLYLAHLWVAFAALEIMARSMTVVIIGDVFDPRVFVAGSVFTIAAMFWGAWSETIDELLPD